MNEKLLRTVDWYLNKNWSVIPIDITTSIEDGEVKKHLHFPDGWKKYQYERVSSDEVENLWQEFSGVAIITGKISGITVIDIDRKDLPEMKDLPVTYMVTTRRGFQFYYRYDPSIRQSQNQIPDVDIRNDGGLVVAPPTIYNLPDGSVAGYSITDPAPIAQFPVDWYQKLLRKYGAKESKVNLKNIVEGVPKGGRNISAASMAGGLLRHYPENKWSEDAWALFKNWNKGNQPPLSDQELQATWGSIVRAERERRITGQKIGEPIIVNIADGHQVSFLGEADTINFEFKNYEASSTTKEVTVRVWVELKDKTKGLPLVQRFNLLSISTKGSFITQLNQAFGKDYNWTLLLSQAIELVNQANEIKTDVEVDFTLPSKKTPFYLFPFVEQDAPNMIFGMGDSGKTFLTLGMALSIGFGKDFLGHKSQNQTNVLFIDYENSENLFRTRLKLLAPELTPDQLRQRMFYLQPDLPLYECVSQLKEIIAKHQIGLLIIDSVAGACGGPLEDSQTVSKFLNALRRTQTTSLLIAHQSRMSDGSSPFGSIFWYNLIRNSWCIKKSDQVEDGIIKSMLKHQKHNNFKRQSDKFAEIRFNSLSSDLPPLDDEDLGSISITEGDQRDWAQEMSITDQILEALELEAMTVKSLSQAVGKRADFIRPYLTRLKNRGLVDKNEEKQGNTWFLVPKEVGRNSYA